MSPESARRLAETLYGPFIKSGFGDASLIDAGAKIIKSHCDLEETLAKLEKLNEEAKESA